MNLNPHADPEISPELLDDGNPKPTRRLPHIGHALLFICTAVLVLFFFQALLAMLGEMPAAVHQGAITVPHPKLQIACLAATYLTALFASYLFFPLLWNRSFLTGIRWNFTAVRHQALRLVALGLLLGGMMQLVTYFITPPKTLPIDEFFASTSDAWLITLFGTVVAPVFEEICFRGFLLPAFAIAYDWLSLPRTEAARMQWETTTNLSPISLLFSAILTSILFAMMHFEQVAHLWAVMLVLFCISLVLTMVRIRTHSVAASATVHAAYNFFVFLMVLIGTGGYRHLDRMH